MTIIQETLKLKRSYPFPHGMGQVEMDLTGSSGAAGSSQSTGLGPDSPGTPPVRDTLQPPHSNVIYLQHPL